MVGALGTGLRTGGRYAAAAATSTLAGRDVLGYGGSVLSSASNDVGSGVDAVSGPMWGEGSAQTLLRVRARELRRLSARRSSSLMPPQTPAS